MSVRTISELIPDQLPGFIRDEAPLFEAFVKAYYEYAEKENESIGAMRHLERNFDIDEASLEFVEYFRREVINEIPETALADPRLLIKNIRQLYKAKGSQNAFKFLFRLLYDADVEFFYPGEKILRASDGRWITQQTLRLQLTQGTASALGGETIIGLTNGGRAVVEEFITTTELGVSVITARLSGVEGDFENDEIFQTQDGSIQGIIFARIGGVSTFAIEDGGGQHQVGDTLAISGAGGTGARATVASVTDQSAITFEIKEGGSGYRANTIYSTTESVGFFTPAIIGGSGQGASFRVVSITDTEDLTLNTDLIDGMENVLIGSDPFSSGLIGGNVNATLASSNAFSQLQNALTFETSGTIGSIDEIEILDPGFGYSTLPSVSVIDFAVQEFLGDNFPDDTGVGGFKGSNAIIVANNMPGAIETLTVTLPGSSYDRQRRADVTNLDRANTFPATGFATPSAISNAEGSYVDTNRGILGGDNVLQDNFFFQEYSYVLRTPISASVYRAVLDKLLHPAGTKFFSEVQVRVEIPFLVTIESETEINFQQQLDVTPLVGDIQVEESQITIRTPVEIGPAEFGAVPNVEESDISFAIADAGDIASTVALGTPEVVLTIEFDSIASTTILSTDAELQFFIEGVGAIAPTIVFGTPEVVLNIEEVGDITSTAVVSADTGIGQPNEPELFLFIEDITIPTSTIFGGQNPIAPLADVELNASPFSSDGDIGTPITTDLAGSDINDTLNDALRPIVVSNV